MKNNYLWTEKYRPNKIKDIILPDHLKDIFEEYTKQKNVPHILFLGSSGVGKTTVAKALCNELQIDCMVINGSMNGNIDTLRNEIQQFVSSVSFFPGRKYVIIDEADGLTNSTQQALRNFMEEFHKNAGFILTANYKNKIIPALQSRCAVVNFKIPDNERGKIAKNMYKRLGEILVNENVECDKEVLKEIVKTYFPDFRKMLSELQANIINNKISSALFSASSLYKFEELIKFMKEKNFTEARKWIGTQNVSSEVLYGYFYNNCSNFLKPQSIPQAVLHIAKYQYQDAFVVDKEINQAAFIIEIMADCVFI